MKYTLLITLLGITSLFYGQAPDGNPDIFEAKSDGDWNDVNTWDVLFGDDADGIPDGDDDVTINGFDVTVTADAGYGVLNFYNTASTDHYLIINAGISLTGYTTDESGDLSVNGQSSTSNRAQITVNGGTLNCNNLNIATNNSNPKAYVYVQNTGTLSIGGNLTFNSSGSAARCLLYGGSGSGNVINIAGNTSGISSSLGRLHGGSTTTSSTITFNGSSAQNIPISGLGARYSKLVVSNTTGATLEGALTTSNLIGDFDVLLGGVLNDGGFDHVIQESFSNAGTYNGSGSLDLSNDFTNSGTFTSSGCNINLEGDWVNSGTYTYASGDNVTFDGFGAVTITGATDWWELTANKSGLGAAGVTVSSGAQNIYGILDLDTKGFNSAGLVTLMSNASGTAQMDNIGTGTFSGGLTVQRYINKTSQSWTSMTSPVSGTTLSSWQANGVIFSGDGAGTFTGADYETFGWHNCLWYDEPSHGSVKADGWAKADNVSNPVGSANSYKAYYVYMDAVPFNISVSGTPVSGAVSVPLDFTASADADQDGWNLIGNPYPCTVDWDLLYADNSSDVEDIYIAYSSEYANYGYYWGAASNPPTGVSSGGVTKDIPHSQGIWVKAKPGGGNLDFTESHKNTTDAPFLKNGSAGFINIMLTSNINSYQDQTMINSNEAYSEVFDDRDLPKFYTMKPDYAPTLYTKSADGVNLSFNTIGSSSVAIQLMATAGNLAQGDYTLDFEVPSTFMIGACISLEDTHTGDITDLRTTSSYTYTTSDTTSVPRFIIHINQDFSTEVENISCNGSIDGAVSFSGTGISGSTFELLDGSGNVAFSALAVNDLVEFTNVPSGTYEVATGFSGACSEGNFTLTVEEPMQVVANFDFVNDTVKIDLGEVLEINNMSSATNYVWDFGDGSTSTDLNPTHAYAAAGIYPVMLTADNDNIGVCTEVFSKNVVVMNGALGVSDLSLEESSKAFIFNGEVVVDFDLENNTDVEITFIDINGKSILSKFLTVKSNRIKLINTNELASGVYLVNIYANNSNTSTKLIVE